MGKYREGERSPSPCSMIVPSIRTSIVALRLTCARLHFHVSGASKPRAASNASAGNSGWSFIGSTASLMTNLRPCSGGAAAIEDLGLVKAWSLWVRGAPQCLQTRWSGPTGHLLHWRNWRS